MQRRGFLSLLAAAASAPLLPGRVAAQAAGYSRSAFGMAVFHARTRVGLTAADLSGRLRVSAPVAEAMMRELSAKGLIATTTGAARALGAARSTAARRSHAARPSHRAAPPAQDKGRPKMDKFTTLTGVAAPLPMVNVDTDMIIPKQFLKTIKRTGLGANLFDEMRFDRDGNEIPDFVLNQPAWREAEILVAGDNFGCGSSREHAPWALLDFGIRCVIAPSFADIFYNNCFKNGILPIALPQEQVDVLMSDAEKGANARMTVDLEAQTITTSDGQTVTFDIDPFRKHCLMNGLDDIGLTMEQAPAIDAFEAQTASARPWL
jgi:3-isopropylmalate/(R)-2-methylmalate dehydratase small subunit